MNYRKILIAVDDSPIAEKISSTGFELGKQLNAELGLLSVVDTASLTAAGGVTPKELAEIIKSDLRKSQQLLMENVFKKAKIRTFLEEGIPYETILKVAAEWEADLIVIGTHGRSGLSRLLMGSVAEHVIRSSTIPVMIIRS